MSQPLPASTTKHLTYISHPLPRDPSIVFHLKQLSSSNNDPNHTSTGTTGTTLWPGAQIMACYLQETLSTPQRPSGSLESRPRILELGSGIGYLALYLASRGFDVLATDIEPVLSDVLRINTANGLRLLSSTNSINIGTIQTISLNWLNPLPINEELKKPFTNIITTDTFYSPNLVLPLWRTLRDISKLHPKCLPTIVIALENRDPGFIESALDIGRGMGFELKSVGRGRLGKAIEKSGWGWGVDDWDGVEVWRGKWKGLQDEQAKLD